MLKRDASAIVGGLSEPGKMPGCGYSIHPRYCVTGSKLRKIPGSVCFGCYACKGNYRFACVQIALERRYQIIKRVLDSGRGSELWNLFTAAMQTLLTGQQRFRVHDAGDLQSLRHLYLWCEIAADSPRTEFWLPSKELTIIRAIPLASIPDNLTIRYSSPTLDKITRSYPVNSATFSKGTVIPESAFVCPAAAQGNTCGDCRACWNPSVETVIYAKH